MNTYECKICHALDGAFRLHCQFCGTTPAQYSLTGSESIMNRNDQIIPVVAATGCSRTEDRRAHKVYHRTVPLDYYATL